VRDGLVVARGASVRETENCAALTTGAASAAKASELAMVQELQRSEAISVRLHQRQTGAGRLVIEFADAASRDLLVNAIKVAMDAK